MENTENNSIILTEQGYISGNTLIKGNTRNLLKILEAEMVNADIYKEKEMINADIYKEKQNLQSARVKEYSLNNRKDIEKEKIKYDFKKGMKVFLIPLIIFLSIFVIHLVLCFITYFLPNGMVGISENSGNLVQGSLSDIVKSEAPNINRLSVFLIAPYIVYSRKVAVSQYGMPDPSNQEQIENFNSLSNQLYEKGLSCAFIFLLIAFAVIVITFSIFIFKTLKNVHNALIAKRSIDEIEKELTNTNKLIDKIELTINDLRKKLKSLNLSQPRITQQYCNEESILFLADCVENEKYRSWGEALSACDNYNQNIKLKEYINAKSDEIKSNIKDQNMELSGIRRRQEEL